MKIVLFGITWASSEIIFVLPVLLLGIGFLVWKFVRARKSIIFLSGSLYKNKLLIYSSIKKHFFRLFFSILGFIFIFLALARPQWGKKKQIVAQEGRDILIAFDISRSMLVEDCKPNRLEFAKQQVKLLLDQLDSDRVGLILFSGSTIVQCPLTSDFSTFYMFLDQLDVETISSGTTAIDQAVKKALVSFSSMPTKKNKLLVLLTDGEDFSSDLAGVRKDAARQGLTIFALGIGTTEGGPIPLLNNKGEKNGHQKDQQGKVIISRLNEGILHNLADQTGGSYMRLNTDSDISLLVKYINKFEKERFGDKKIESLEEKYPYFLLVSFMCFAIEWLL